MNLQRMFSTLIGACCAVTLAGCGGGGGAPAASDGRGALQMAIQWPSVTRLVPITSQAIVVVVKTTGGAVIASPPVVTRPVGTSPVSNVTIPSLPAGPVVVFATAFPQPDASGNSQATGSLTVTVTAGATTTTKPLVMNTTVKKIVLTPSATSVAVGGQITVSASAEDVNSNMVVVAPDHYVGAENDASAFTIVHAGAYFTLTAKKTGTFSFSVKDSESGVSSPLLALAVTAAPVSSLFVWDQTNARIVGLTGAAPGASFTPSTLGIASSNTYQDMAVDRSGNVYVAVSQADTNYSSAITEVDSGFNPVNSFSPTETITGGQSILFPYQICVNPAGNNYWFAQTNAAFPPVNTIYRVDSITGFPSTVKKVALPNSVYPILGGMAADGNFLYVADAANDTIYRIAADLSGSWSAAYGSKGNGRDNFDLGGNTTGNANHGLSLDPTGTHLYVADYNNTRIVQITTAGFNSLPATADFNFTAVPLTNSATNGANDLKPISVAVDGSNQHIYFTDIEVKSRTGSDYLPPIGTNVANSFVERIDVSGVSTHKVVNRTSFGGAITTTGAANHFGKPAAVGVK